MTAQQQEAALQAATETLKRLVAAAPEYGSVTLTLSLCGGVVTKTERGVVETQSAPKGGQR